MIVNILLFVLSVAVLIFASDKFVGAAEKIGLSLGISPFIIGVSIVAFGTSLPELATSIFSVVDGQSEIVVGNVIGSNITNVLLVLGLTAVMARKIDLDYDVMDIDMPLLFISAFLLWFAIADGHFSFFEAMLFIIALVVFLMNSISNRKADNGEKSKSAFRDYVTLIFGGILVYFGAAYTVEMIENIALDLGADPVIIAVTALALGTSLPEVVVSLAATARGQHAIAIGNILGSNIFNTYAVMAFPSFLGPLVIPEQILSFYLPFMLVVTALFGFICLSKKISMWEGVMLLVFYAFFIGESIKNTVG